MTIHKEKEIFIPDQVLSSFMTIEEIMLTGIPARAFTV